MSYYGTISAVYDDEALLVIFHNLNRYDLGSIRIKGRAEVSISFRESSLATL